MCSQRHPGSETWQGPQQGQTDAVVNTDAATTPTPIQQSPGTKDRATPDRWTANPSRAHGGRRKSTQPSQQMAERHLRARPPPVTETSAGQTEENSLAFAAHVPGSGKRPNAFSLRWEGRKDAGSQHARLTPHWGLGRRQGCVWRGETLRKTKCYEKKCFIKASVYKSNIYFKNNQLYL